jgi:hypothetical protein
LVRERSTVQSCPAAPEKSLKNQSHLAVFRANETRSESPEKSRKVQNDPATSRFSDTLVAHWNTFCSDSRGPTTRRRPRPGTRLGRDFGSGSAHASDQREGLGRRAVTASLHDAAALFNFPVQRRQQSRRHWVLDCAATLCPQGGCPAPNPLSI